MGREWDVQSTPRHSGHRRCIVDQCKPYFGPQRAIASPTIQENGVDDSFPEQKDRPRRWGGLLYSVLTSTEFCSAKSACESKVAAG